MQKKYNKPEGNTWEKKDLRIAKLSVATNRLNLINSLIPLNIDKTIKEIEEIADEIIERNYTDEKLQNALLFIYAGLPDKVQQTLFEIKEENKKERLEELNNKQNLTSSEQKELETLKKELIKPF